MRLYFDRSRRLLRIRKVNNLMFEDFSTFADYLVKGLSVDRRIVRFPPEFAIGFADYECTIASRNHSLHISCFIDFC